MAQRLESCERPGLHNRLAAVRYSGSRRFFEESGINNENFILVNGRLVYADHLSAPVIFDPETGLFKPMEPAKYSKKSPFVDENPYTDKKT